MNTIKQSFLFACFFSSVLVLASCGKCHKEEPLPIAETVTLPHAGDVVIPATGDDGSFSIPGEKGLYKVEKHECFIDSKGRKICK